MEGSERKQPDVRWDRLAWGAIVLGAAIRLIWVLFVHPPQDYVFSDMQGYVERATRVATGAEMVRYDAFYPPGTHLLLSVPLAIFGTGEGGLRAGALLWWVLSSATPLFAWLLARRLLSSAAAALTAVLCALYPLFVFYSGYFSSETPSLALLTGALWLGYRARQAIGRTAVVSAAGAGVLGAAALANRPQFLLNLAIVAIPLLWQARTRWRAAAAFALSGAVVLGGVLAYNSAAADRLTLLSENGGMVFYQGQCDVHLVSAGTPGRGGNLTFGNPVAFELGRGQDRAFPDRAGWDQGFFYREGLKCVTDDGLGHASRLWRNLIDAGARATPFPLGAPERQKATARGVNLAYSLLVLPILAGAVLLIVAGRRQGLGMAGERDLVLHLLCLVPVVVLFSSEPRYRILYDVFGLALLATIIAYTLGRARAPEVSPRQS